MRPLPPRSFQRLFLAAALALSAAAPAAAQFSDSFNFLKAVRDRDGNEATKYLDKARATIINTKDLNTGETALHIVARRRDADWLSYFLSKGANPDSRDREGITPLMIASQLGWADGVTTLLAVHADVNATNNRGENPIILAVQNRDLATVRLLLTNGADPRRADRIAGMSARDYAARDARSATILKLIDDTPPPAPKKAVAGPVLR